MSEETLSELLYRLSAEFPPDKQASRDVIGFVVEALDDIIVSGIAKMDFMDDLRKIAEEARQAVGSPLAGTDTPEARAKKEATREVMSKMMARDALPYPNALPETLHGNRGTADGGAGENY